MTKLLKCAGIYVLTNRENGKCYVGKDHHLGSRTKKHLALQSPQCPAIHNAIKVHGKATFDVELVHYPNISEKALCEVERWKIRQLGAHYSQKGYNLTWGGDGGDPETSREIQRKRVAEGTHNFLGGEIARETNHKRVENGTHNLLGERNPVHKRVAEGTNSFQVIGFYKAHREFYQEAARERNRRHLADGTHHFLGDSNPVHKRVAEGTHHFLDPDFQRKNCQKGRYAHKIKRKNQRRELYRIYAALLTAKSVCEDRIYRKRIREGFFDKEIPDTSNTEQLDFLG